MKPTRVEILTGDGEWQELHGITNVVVYDESEQARATAERIREIHEAMIAFARVYMEAIRPVLDQFARHLQAMRDAGLIDDDGKPTTRPDRPAWQSPYGPPRSR